MKTFLKLSLTTIALSASACTVHPARSAAFSGRIIEFKSGPEGFDTRTFFYESEKEVVAFDSQFTPALAEKSIQHLRTFTDKPITWLVITHPNPDKFNGASVFKAGGTRILASAETARAIQGVHAYKEAFFVNTAKMFKKGEYPQPVAVDEEFAAETEMTLLNGEKIQLRRLAHPGVSGTQTVAYIPAVNALIVGDLVHHKAHAWLEGGIVEGRPVPTLDGWISNLRDLQRFYPANARVFGGRGQNVELNQGVREQIRYLQVAREIVKEFLRKLGSRKTELDGPRASSLYQELAAKFQSQFPDFELPYMIEYGSYGLVQQELKK